MALWSAGYSVASGRTGGSAAFALTGVFCAISMAALVGGADAPFLHTAVGVRRLSCVFTYKIIYYFITYGNVPSIIRVIYSNLKINRVSFKLTLFLLF